jgi:thymidylate synthase
MSRIFADWNQAIKEIPREVKELGITVPISHYQDKVTKGNKDFYTKELIGYSFKVSSPLSGLDDMVSYIYPKENQAKEILEYCKLELSDRVGGKPVNPGEAHKSRYSLWEEFLEDKQKFSYTYSERISDPSLECDQLRNIINELKQSPDSRQAVVVIFNPLYDHKNIGGKHRIPCSMYYQFLVRNKKVHGIYTMRSNDIYAHFVVDMWEAVMIQKYVADNLGLEVGSFTYFGGSLHAYAKDFPNFVF